MRRMSLSALWVFFALAIFAAPAQAAPAPYTDWAFDVRRADEADDLDRIAELTRAQPDFARIWFYGQVFDLVTVGLPDEVKEKLRPRLATVARTLGELEPPDPRPALYVDWASTGRLTELAARARELQDQWINAVRAGQPLPARLAAAEHPEEARPVYYMLFFRAELAARRLGGEREKKLLLAVARRMAEGFALAEGEVGPWRTLAGYLGGRGGVSLDGEGVVESQVGSGLNAYVMGDLPGARRNLDAALSTARNARSGNIFVALALNGAAHAASWMGDFPAERALRVRVLQAVRPLQNANLTVLVADQMVRAHLADSSVDDMVAYTREMREMGEVVMRTGRHLRTLEQAAMALSQAAHDRAKAGDLEAAERVMGEARVLSQALTERDAVAITIPSERVAEVQRQRLVDLAELLRVEAGIAERRGRFDAARAGYEQVRVVYEGQVADPIATAGVDLDLARVILDAGDAEAALAATAKARAALDPGGPPALRAERHRLTGTARLALGQAAPAFAHANAGLSLLREAGIADEVRPLRGRLHLVAATALELAGFAEESLARLQMAGELAPFDGRVARALAVRLTEAGRYDAAREALKPMAESLQGRAARIEQNCILVRAGRSAEAIPSLRTMVPQLTLRHLRRAQLIGRICLAAAYLSRGDRAQAANALRPARALILEHPDPQLVWRVHALDGQLAAAGRSWLDAAGAWRQVVDRYVEVLGERSWRGVLPWMRTLAAPADPGVIAQALPDALVSSATRDRANAPAHHAEALKAADWADRFAAAPRMIQLTPGAPASTPGALHQSALPAADNPARGLMMRASRLAEVLGDPSVITAERVAATQSYRETVSGLRDVSSALAKADPRLSDFLSPWPRAVSVADGEALLRYRVGEQASHLWIVRKGAPIQHFALPGAAALAAALAPAREAIEEAPADWEPQKRRPKDPNADDWAALEKAARVVLPFLRDAALAEALAGLKLRVVPDGPLVDFPLDALVIAPAPRVADGAPPAFFGARFTATYALPTQAAGGRADASAQASLFGPVVAEGCTDCAAPEAAGLAVALGALTGFAQVTGEATDAAGMSRALGGEVLFSAAPLDLSAGAIVVRGDDGAAARLGGAALGLRQAGAEAFIALRPSWGADAAAGWRALGAALRAAGVTTVVAWAGGARPGERGLLLARRLTRGIPLRGAVHLGLRDALAAKVDPAVGGAALHHPYHWARWVVYGPAVDRATLEEGLEAVPAEAPQQAAPVDPYAD